MEVIPQTFYLQDTVTCAQSLLGKLLVRTIGTKILIGLIVETEAYLGLEDPACHSARGRTNRTEVMFGEGGHAYVYQIYGMYYCLNAVTGSEGVAHAVLIRALEPLVGLDYMNEQRPNSKNNQDLCNGPGKLCQAFSINRNCNGINLFLNDSELKIMKNPNPMNFSIITTKRIGIKEAVDWPLRFYIKGNTSVSKH